jgi:hypothetical protein
MPGQLGSATVNAVNNKRNNHPYQEPIGATTGDMDNSLINGCIGGGFAAVDSIENFALNTQGVSTFSPTGGVDSLYVLAMVDVPAGTADAVVGPDGKISAATGGSYTVPLDVKAGEYCWAYLT